MGAKPNTDQEDQALTEKLIEEMDAKQLEERADEVEAFRENQLRELKRKAHVYDDLVDQETTTGELFKTWKEYQATAAEAKKEYDGAVLELRRLIRTQTEDLPLFDGLADAEPDESWREVKLESLEWLTAKILEKLGDAGHKTIGNLADYSFNGGRLVSIAGIGPAAATKIEDSLESFWANHPGLEAGNDSDLARKFGSSFVGGLDAFSGGDGVIDLVDVSSGDLEHVIPGDLIKIATVPTYYGEIEIVDDIAGMVTVGSACPDFDRENWSIAKPNVVGASDE